MPGSVTVYVLIICVQRNLGYTGEVAVGVRMPSWTTRFWTARLLAGLVLSALVAAPLAHAAPPGNAGRPAAHPAVHLCAAAEQTKVRPVWSGSKGWLFSRPDLITDLVIPDTAPRYLGRIAAALKAEGVTPVALIVPTRGSVAYRHMQANPALASYNPWTAARGYEAFLEQLRRAGFIAPDLLAVAHSEGEGFFFKRDHHWTPRAARAVAWAVAAELRAQLTQLEPLPQTGFATRARPPRKQLGTLQRRAHALCPAFSWPLETVTQFETQPEKTQQPLSEALFAPQSPQLVLAGTSNSHRGGGKPELNFGGFLQSALGLEVLNVSFPGSGVYGSLDAYVRSPEFRHDRPVALLWETPYMSWHSRSSLEAELRQVLPGIYGACPQPLVQRQRRGLPKGRTKLLDVPDAPAQRLYLHLSLDDHTLTNFRFRLRYPNYTEELEVRRTTRVPNTGEFFLDLGEFGGRSRGPLAAVGLELPKPALGGARVSVCSFPAASAPQ